MWITQNRIVGKGNHSFNHVQRIKPCVEKVCRDLGLQYATEENTGRVYIDLTGGPAQMPPHATHHKPHPHHADVSGYPGQQHAGVQDAQQDQPTVSKVFRRLEQLCCVVM
jgi:hypothetical protein